MDKKKVNKAYEEQIAEQNKAFLAQLKNPFDPKLVKWRPGAITKDKKKAIALAYLDAREVYKRLDDVCGIDGWSSKFIEIKDGFICELSIRMPNGEWVTKSDSADFTDIERIKGGASSALKRAAAVWGIGRYLYYLPAPYVEIDEYKKLKYRPEMPDWAKPSHAIRWDEIEKQVYDEDDTPEFADSVKATKEKKAKIINANK